jgi:uroporphyrinogen decarboxylase
MDAIEMEAFFAQSMSYENVPVLAGEMSPRERFYAIMDFVKFDRVMDCEFGYWNDTLRRWHNEGLPKQVDSIPKADLFFGFDRWQKNLPIPNNILPFFEEEIVERGERHTIGYDGRRVKRKVFTDGTDSIPHYLDFPIKDRESYLPFKERFLPQLHQRIPAAIAEIARQSAQRNYCLLLYAGSTAGWIRDLMGFEGFSLGICLQPELIDEILADLSQLYESIATALVHNGIEVDVVAWWEDVAFKTGPIVPPDWFSEKCGPVYQRTLSRYAQSGTRFSYVDCDGDNRLLVPTWLDNGVNIIFPLEVNAGIHPQTLRTLYPAIRMMGGFDKVVLLEGTDAIRKELLRLKPLVEEGGFIPHVDHRVQADVSYRDYLYYLEAKRDIFEIPNKIMDVDAVADNGA